MWDDFISQQIQRTNRNMLKVGGCVLAILGLILAVTWRDTYNFVFGPFPVQSSELITVESPDAPKRYFLKVEGEESFATGMRLVDSSNHKKILAEIVALAIDKRLLLVKTPLDNQQVQFTGTLAPIPPELMSSVVREWDQKHPEEKGAFLPYMLDATGFRKGDNLWVAGAAIAIGLLGLWLVALPLGRLIQPDHHPLLKQLAKYGHLTDIRMRINSEIRGENGGEKIQSMQITSNWLIVAAPYKTSVMAAKDVVWAYPKVTKHYHNGIPTGKTFSAIIRDSKGQSLEISGKQDSVPKMMESLQRRMPWVLVGFSKELDVLWTKEKPKFMQLIEQRRAKLAPATR